MRTREKNKIKEKLSFEMLKRTKLEQIILEYIQGQMVEGDGRCIKDFNLEELRFYIQKKKKEFEKTFKKKFLY